MKSYQEKKDAARQEAIDWQINESDKDVSYSEFVEIIHRFYRIGKRFGLLREFRENGIPC